MILKQIIKHSLILSFVSLFCFNSLIAKEYFVQLKTNKDSTLFFNDLKNEFLKGDLNQFYYKKAFKTLQSKGLDRVFVVNFPSKYSNEQVLSLGNHPMVSLIELVPDYEFFHTPNDFNSTAMWHLDKIQARDAWDIEKGGKNILIAIVDDGIDTAHSEFQSSIWKNPNEIASNGIDDDNNGYVDDVFGWDMADNDNNPSVISSNNLSHGTHCAGIAAARTNNNNGISSISYFSKIMTIKCGRNGSSQIFNPYQGVEYAIENGARIISMSWGGGSYSSIYETIFAVAAQNNILCIAAAGNSSTNSKMYPAGYNNVIAVGSTTSTDAKSSFSNYGNWIDVMAPGSSIYSTVPGNTYATYSGTSMACPMVSGLCALMLSRNPNLTATQVENCLKNTCDNIDFNNQSYIGDLGAGRINALKALRCIKSVYASFNTSKTFVCTGDTIHFKDLTSQTPNSWLWEFPGGTPNVSTNQNPIVRYSSNGTYNVKLTVIRGNDTDIITKTNYINVGNLEAKFSGVQTINRGEYATIKVDFTGKAPWTLIYQGNNKRDTIKNILSSPHFILKKPDSSIVYKPISVTSNNCSGQVKDSTRITVIQSISGGGNNICDSSLRFHATFGGNTGNHIGFDIEVVQDSIIFVAGTSFNSSNSSDDGFICRLNKEGQVMWFKLIGNNRTENVFTLKVDQNLNSYIVGATFSQNGSDKMMFYSKFNKDGTTLWQKFINGNSLEYMRDIVISSYDKRYLYFIGPGISNSFGGEDFILIKCDTLGNTIWTRDFGNSNLERPEGVTEDNDGNIYIVGYRSNGSLLDRVLLKISNSGSLIFSNAYSNNSLNSFLFSVTHYKNFIYTSGYVHTNSSNREYNVSKFRLNGDVVWSKIYTANTNGNAISQTNIEIKNNRIYNSWSVNKSSVDGYIMTLDTNGNILLYNSIGATNEDNINGISSLSDNSLYYVGSTNSSNKQVMIGKVNCKLKSVCRELNNTLSVQNISLTKNNIGFQSSTYNYFVNISNSINNISFNPNYNCKTTPNTTPKPDSSKCKLYSSINSFPSCLGDTSKFIASVIDSNNYNINGITWHFGDLTTLSNTYNPSKIYRNAGTFLVKLIVNSSKSGKSCSDTSSIFYTINNDVKLLTFPTNQTICIGDSLQTISPFISCGIKPYEYEWLPNSNINNNKLLNPHFSPKKTTTYTLIVKDKNGIIAKDSFTLTVKTDCCKSIARFETNKENICSGDSVSITNSSNYDANSAFFKWTFIGASINSHIGKTPPVFKITGNKASIKLELSDLCSNDTLIQNFFVFPLPTINIQKNYAICRLDTLQLGEEAFGRTSYTWTPSFGLNNNRISNPVAIVNNTTQYTLNITDEYGCKNKDSVLITNYQIDKFNLGNDTGFCQNSFVQLKAPFTNDSILWSTGEKSNTITALNKGLYWLKIKNNTCSFEDTIFVDQFNLPEFKINSSSLTYCRTPILLSSNKTFNNAIYNWNDGSNSSSNNIQKAGKFILTITDSNKCQYKDSITINQGQLPVLFEIPDTTICESTNFFITAPNIPNQTYLWNNTQSGPSYLVTRGGNYTLRASTQCGDTSVSFKVITEDCNCYLWIPNAFSPNNDQVNDKFEFVSTCPIIEFDIKIYSNWGELLFQTNDPNFKWDGTYKGELLPLGVYFYVVKYRKSLNNLQLFEEDHGFINLIE
jgi:gliding motility-associated-like protein